MDDKSFIIPKTIDDPVKIGYLTTQQFLILFFSFYVGVLLGSPEGFCVSVVIGIGLAYFYGKNQNKGKGVAMAIFYWSFSSWLTQFRYFPKSYKRRYIG